jgi:ABC-type uncharacterized transport system ATPase subunit
MTTSVSLCKLHYVFRCDSFAFGATQSSALDPASRLTMWRLISAVQRHYAVLLTTHSMLEADVLCNRVAILRNGRLIELDSPIALKQKHSKFMTLTVRLLLLWLLLFRHSKKIVIRCNSCRMKLCRRRKST